MTNGYPGPYLRASPTLYTKRIFRLSNDVCTFYYILYEFCCCFRRIISFRSLFLSYEKTRDPFMLHMGSTFKYYTHFTSIDDCEKKTNPIQWGRRYIYSIYRVHAYITIYSVSSSLLAIIVLLKQTN